jgi:hypothetical protein
MKEAEAHGLELAREWVDQQEKRGGAQWMDKRNHANFPTSSR